MLYFILFLFCLIPLVVGGADKFIDKGTVIWEFFRDGIRYPKIYLNAIGLLAIFFVGIRYYKFKPFKNIWMFLFLMWAIHSSISSRYMFSYEYLFYILCGILGIFTLASINNFFSESISLNNGILLFPTRKKEECIRDILRVIAIVGIIQCFYIMLQALCFDQFFIVIGHNKIGEGSPTHRLVGTVGNPVIVSIMLAMILPIYLYFKKRWGYLGFILCSLTIYMCQGTTGFVAAIVGTMFFLFFIHRKIFIILLITIIFGCGYLGNKIYNDRDYLSYFYKSSGRTEIWKEAYSKWEKRITGQGLGAWTYEMGLSDKTREAKWKEAHNDYIQILYDLGITGLFLYLGFIWSVFASFWKNKTLENTAMMSCMVAFAVSSLTLFPLYTGVTLTYAVLFVGLILNGKEKEKMANV